MNCQSAEIVLSDFFRGDREGIIYNPEEIFNNK